MVNQPIPIVTDDDVIRVARRDFSDRLEEVLSILGEFGKQQWNQTPSHPRVRLSILKIAQCNFERLSETTELAINDYRDVIAPAEYPRYLTLSSGSTAEERAAIDEDWKEYCDWLGRKADYKY